MRDYKEVVSTTRNGGTIGSFGIKILVDQDKIDRIPNDILRVLRNAEEAIYKAYAKEIIKNDPKTKEESYKNKKLLNVFDGLGAIFIEEIPNGYCSDWCCEHLPWFIATTKIGRIKIGWRKSVINIDWSDTLNPYTAEELFKDEDVTKGEKFIHAWSTEKAGSYIRKIIGEL